MELDEARTEAIRLKLKGPEWALNVDLPIEFIRKRIGSSGGCGPGIAGDRLVPDRILFINIKPACYIHDCEYHDAKTPEAKYNADKNLFNNAETIVRKKSANKLMYWLRMRTVFNYYAAVDIFGGGFIDG